MAVHGRFEAFSEPLSLAERARRPDLKSVDKRRCNTLLRSLVPLSVRSLAKRIWRGQFPNPTAGCTPPTVVRIVLTSCGVRVTVQSDVTSRRHRDECQSVRPHGRAPLGASGSDDELRLKVDTKMRRFALDIT